MLVARAFDYRQQERAILLPLICAVLCAQACLAGNERIVSPTATAKQLLNRRHPDRALAVLDAVLKERPSDQSAQVMKAQALDMVRKYNDALKILDAILKRQPRNANVLAVRAAVNLSAGCFDAAMKDANLAIAIDPRCADAYIVRAKFYHSGGMVKEAAKQCAKAVQVSSNNRDILREQSELLRNSRRGALTVETLNKAIKLAPDDTRCYDALAHFYIERGKYGQAFPYCKRSLELDPEDGFALLLNSALWRARKNQRAALREVDKAAAAIPWSGLPHFFKGEILASMMEEDEALQEFSKAIEMQPEQWQFYISRANTYLVKRDYKASMADLNLAYQVSHRDPIVLSSRADVYSLMKDYEAAFKDLSTLIRANPNNGGAYSRRGAVLKSMNRIRDAELDFSKAVELSPTEIMYERRGYFYISIKEFKKAIADFNTALKFDSGDKKALRGLSIAYESIGDKARAAKLRSMTAGDVEGFLNQYSRASDSFSRLKHDLAK